jgi:hypothetical protein
MVTKNGTERLKLGYNWFAATVSPDSNLPQFGFNTELGFVGRFVGGKTPIRAKLEGESGDTHPSYRSQYTPLQ